MACTILSRLFHRRNWQPLPRAQGSLPPLCSDENAASSGPQLDSFANLDTTPSLTREKPIMTSEAQIDVAAMATVTIVAIPSYLPLARLDDFFQFLPRLVQIRKRATHPQSVYDLLLDFEPNTDVRQIFGANSCGRNNYVAIDDFRFLLDFVVMKVRPATYEVVSRAITQLLPPNAPGERPRLSRVVKLNHGKFEPAACYICCNELGTEPYSTPCTICRQAECYDCIQRQFRSALEDFTRFPARCCMVTLHPDVAKGILPEEEHTQYRWRFEEWFSSSKKRTYCPVPTCSAFIPPRTTREQKGKKIKCYQCGSDICLVCKQLAHEGRPCESTQQEELLAIMKSFGYKQCPKCNMAVGKMYGCSHIACKCGAHWCWECQRKFEECNMSPCDGNRDVMDEGFELDGDGASSIVADSDDEEAQDEIEEAVASIAHESVHAPAEDEFDFESPSAEPEWLSNIITRDSVRVAQTARGEAENETADFVNLDDPTAHPWEATEFDFGDEPMEEDSLDIWGCDHRFRHFTSDNIPRYWMTASNADFWERAERPEFSCMRCWKATKAMPGDEASRRMDEAERARCAKSSRGARECCACRVVVCKRCKQEIGSGKD